MRSLGIDDSEETRERLQNATKEITKLANEQSGFDLLELLREAPREAYSLQQPGWPSEMRNVAQKPLPKIVLERYERRQSVCFCGCFPEISRAWATVDDSLFLWRFDVDDDVPLEFDEFNGQPIVSVGLCKPTKGVFVKQIQRILVVCTTVEIKMLGLVSDLTINTNNNNNNNNNNNSSSSTTTTTTTTTIRNNDNNNNDSNNGETTFKNNKLDEEYNFDPSAPLLIRDTTFSCPTDAIVFNQICGCSKSGRIFLAGNDSNAYELKYHAGGGGDFTLGSNQNGGARSFFSRGAPRVHKVKFSSTGLSSYIPQSLNMFTVEDPLVQILSDEERHILYTRSQSGAVRVYDLGAKGLDSPRKVVEVKFGNAVG
jgi:nuclear pore complex protein Nup155